MSKLIDLVIERKEKELEELREARRKAEFYTPDDIVDKSFNPPYTNVKFKDGKTFSAKCADEDKFDPTVGFSMAYTKAQFGSRKALLEFLEDDIAEYEDEYCDCVAEGLFDRELLSLFALKSMTVDEMYYWIDYYDCWRELYNKKRLRHELKTKTRCDSARK